MFIFFKKKRFFCIIFCVFIIFFFKSNCLISNIKYYFSNFNVFFDNSKHNFYFLVRNKIFFFNYFINKIYEDNVYLKRKNYILSAKLLFLNKLIFQNNIYRKFLFLPLNNFFNYSLVKVISFSLLNNDHVYINKGENDGIILGTFLFNYDGLVGNVVLVKKNVSKIKLVCSLNNVFSVKILRSGINSLIYGNGCNNSMKIIDLPLNSDIKLGDIIVTYNSDIFYPFGYPVAFVNNIYWDKECLCKVVTAKPFVKFSHLNYLAIFNFI